MSSLQDLLADGIRFAPHYRPDDNSDHLPMTLAAMSGLGATGTQLKDFRRDYLTRLHACPAPDENLESWEQGLGRQDAYPDLLRLFRRALTPADAPALRAAVLRVTLPGLALDAFHPIIRLGYAVDFDSRDEQAAALAYLVAMHRDIPVSMQPLDLAGALSAQSAAGDQQLATGRFGPGIMALVDSGRYPVGTAGSFEVLAVAALGLYQSTRNFFALHLVTSTQALRVCVPAELESLAVAAMTGAMLASHLVLGSPQFGGQRLAVPRQLDPVHAYKYAWACVSEYRAYGNREYLAELRALRHARLVPGWAGAALVGDTD